MTSVIKIHINFYAAASETCISKLRQIMQTQWRQPDKYTNLKYDNKYVISGFYCGEYEVSTFLRFHINKPPIYTM